MPDYLIPLGRTVGFAANGAVSNLSVFPDAITTMRRELRAGDFDVVHVQEPPGADPRLGRLLRSAGAPGRRHLPRLRAEVRRPTTSPIVLGARRKFNQLSARIAVSEAAEWTGRRWFGGNYEIIPNGVDLGLGRRRARPRRDDGGAAAPVRRPRRGAQGPAGPAARLRGARRARPRPPRDRRHRARGGRALARRPRVARARSTRSARSTASASGSELAAADVLCAPSLSGRELRDGPDRGLRRRDAGDRLRRSPATPTSSATASTGC